MDNSLILDQVSFYTDLLGDLLDEEGIAGVLHTFVIVKLSDECIGKRLQKAQKKKGGVGVAERRGIAILRKNEGAVNDWSR